MFEFFFMFASILLGFLVSLPLTKGVIRSSKEAEASEKISNLRDSSKFQASFRSRWEIAVLSIFENLFSSRFWSLKFLFRSAIVSALSLGLHFYYTSSQTMSLTGRNFINNYGDQAVFAALFLLFVNIIADYLSLGQTKVMLKHSAERHTPAGVTIAKDVVATAAIYMACFSIGFVMIWVLQRPGSTYVTVSNGLMEFAEQAVDRPRWNNWYWFYGQRVTEAGYILSVTAATTFLTSVWSVFLIFGLMFKALPIALLSVFRLTDSYVDSDEHPIIVMIILLLTGFLFVMGVASAVGYFLF